MTSHILRKSRDVHCCPLPSSRQAAGVFMETPSPARVSFTISTSSSASLVQGCGLWSSLISAKTRVLYRALTHFRPFCAISLRIRLLFFISILHLLTFSVGELRFVDR